MKDVFVREYSDKDFDSVNSILEEAFHICKKCEIRDDTFTELVCESHGKIVGYLLITRILDPVKNRLKYHIDYVCVDSKYRGNGIGQMLMEYVEALGKKESVLYIELTSSRFRMSAHRLYEKCGYVRRDSDIFRKELV